MKVTKEELSALGQGQGHGDLDTDRESSVSSQSRKGKKAWEKTPFVTNNFEHRHTAQQKLLDAQQRQLKEQQRLIEEMQYLQRQQLLQQQLMQPSPRIPDGTQAMGGGGGDGGGETPKLQSHLNNLQMTLVEGGATSEVSTDRSVDCLEFFEYRYSSPSASVITSSVRQKRSHTKAGLLTDMRIWGRFLETS